MLHIYLYKVKEVLDALHPYFKWIVFLVYGAIFLYINRVFMKDETLRKWLLGSLSENGVASGKSLTAFIFSKLIAISTLAAIIYSPSHLLPEYYLISLLTFISSLYGIRLASKYFNTGDSSFKEQTNETTNKQEPIVTNTDDKKTSAKDVKSNDSGKINSPDDLG